MRDYEVGYGKPPRPSRFKKGQSGNPRGRPRRGARNFEDIIRAVLGKQVEYRANGLVRRTPRLELVIKRHVVSALNGNIGSASFLINMRDHAKNFADAGPLIIEIINSPDLFAKQSVPPMATA
jgi:hypothetical protein